MGMDDKRIPNPMIKNPIHQAPTQRGSFRGILTLTKLIIKKVNCIKNKSSRNQNIIKLETIASLQILPADRAVNPLRYCN